jgi:hypothetical protein
MVNVLSGDASITDRLRETVGSRIKGFGNDLIIKRVRATTSSVTGSGTAATASVTLSGSLFAGTATAGEYSESGIQSIVPLLATSRGARVARDDLFLGGVLRLLDGRASDSRSGFVTGGLAYDQPRTRDSYNVLLETASGSKTRVSVSPILNETSADLKSKEWYSGSVTSTAVGEDIMEVHVQELSYSPRTCGGNNRHSSTVVSKNTDEAVTGRASLGQTTLISHNFNGNVNMYGESPLVTCAVRVAGGTDVNFPEGREIRLIAVGVGGEIEIIDVALASLSDTSKSEDIKLSGVPSLNLGPICTILVNSESDLNKEDIRITVTCDSPMFRVPRRSIVLDGYSALKPVTFETEDFYLGWDEGASNIPRNNKEVTLEYLLTGKESSLPVENAQYFDA